MGKRISAVDILPYDEYVKIEEAVENKVGFDYRMPISLKKVSIYSALLKKVVLRFCI